MTIDVSVIIPTAGKRPAQLVKAVRSVQQQRTTARVQLVIVDDSNGLLDRSEITGLADDVPVQFVLPSLGRGPRSEGVTNSTGHFVAFLDDDDLWDPDKLQKQLGVARAIEARGMKAVVSCRLRHSFDSSERLLEGVPRQTISSGTRVDEYLFYRRPPSPFRPCLYTSTLLVSRHVAEEVVWRRIPRHQDWDWLLRADLRADVVVEHHPDVLATIHVGSVGSISAGADWRSSLEWVQSIEPGTLSKRAYRDFLAGQVLRYALSARSLKGTTLTIAAVLRSGGFPSVRSTIVGLSGILPRAQFQKIMAVSGRAAQASSMRS